MANTTLRGFRWFRSKTGAGRPPIEVHRVADDYNTLLAKGDPVKFVSTGYMERAAAAATDIYGIMVGAEQYWDGTYLQRGNHVPANTSYDTNLARETRIFVIPVFGQVFEVDADDGTTATTEAGFIALVGENCDHVIESVSGNISGAALDISDHKTTTAQWRILGISRRVDQDYASSRVKLLVECNESSAPMYSTSGV